jgi:preprotein translocase subunit SecG
MVYLYWSTLILFLSVCVILILLVLIQKGRGGGLAGAFGGAGGNTAFGSKTGDVLTWATSILFGVFLLLAVATNWLSNSLDGQQQNQASAVTAAPNPAQRGPGLPGGLGGAGGAGGQPIGAGEEPGSAGPGGGIPTPVAPAAAPAPAPTSAR